MRARQGGPDRHTGTVAHAKRLLPALRTARASIKEQGGQYGVCSFNFVSVRVSRLTNISAFPQISRVKRHPRAEKTNHAEPRQNEADPHDGAPPVFFSFSPFLFFW